MPMNHFTTHLYGAWWQAVAAGEVANHFVAPQDDPAERWQAGERIIFGVRHTGEEFAFYAHNLDSEGRYLQCRRRKNTSA